MRKISGMSRLVGYLYTLFFLFFLNNGMDDLVGKKRGGQRKGACTHTPCDVMNKNYASQNMYSVTTYSMYVRLVF